LLIEQCSIFFFSAHRADISSFFLVSTVRNVLS